MIREILPPDTGTTFAAMRALRSALTDVDSYVRRVDDVQRPQGYRLVAAFGDGEEAVAVAGFRVLETLAWGRVVYIDDLSTLPGARRTGQARALLDWVAAEAARLGCDQVHLDSGYGPERADAHRLYLNSGFALASHHFARPVEAAPAGPVPARS